MIVEIVESKQIKCILNERSESCTRSRSLFWGYVIKTFSKCYMKYNYVYISFRCQARKHETKQRVKRDNNKGQVEVKIENAIAFPSKNRKQAY